MRGFRPLSRRGRHLDSNNLVDPCLRATRRGSDRLSVRVAHHASRRGHDVYRPRAIHGSAMNRREFLAAAAVPAVANGARFTKSICSVIFPQGPPLAECFRRAKSAGFGAIEIRMGDEAGLDSTPEQMKQLAGEARKAGIAIASMWVSRPLSENPINSPDPAVRARGIAAL